MKPKLTEKGLKVRIIDGDEVRARYPAPLGFEVTDVTKNNLNIAEMAKESASEFDVVLIPVIAPYEEARAKVKDVLGKSLHFIYCEVPLEKVIQRDTKGLYGKSLKGEIKNMIGMSDKYPYQAPKNPQLVLNNLESVEICAEKLFNYVVKETL